ncbi:MAG: L-asparaginase, partial [Flavobacteriales bacterium]
AKAYDAVVVVHGTDRLHITGERTYAENPTPRVPIVFTGAMRPYELRDTDSVQNMTEAFLAAKLLEPGVWCVMHNTALAFPGVTKNRQTMSFERL